MTFAVQPESYDRFMGRYSTPLAPKLADLAGVRAGQRALDVGCGPGALTEELVSRLGPGSVSAVDPSEPFVAAARERHPGVDVHQAGAEELPFPDGRFDAAVAQLVIHFMSDPAAGVAEMRRVTRAGGVVAGCVWDHGGGEGPLSVFWRAARELEPDVDDEGRLMGSNKGDLERLFRGSGLRDVEETFLTVSVAHQTFEDWWEPYTLGVGPAGAHVARLDQEGRDVLRERCRVLLPEPPFVLEARAWAARGLA